MLDSYYIYYNDRKYYIIAPDFFYQQKNSMLKYIYIFYISSINFLFSISQKKDVLGVQIFM